MSSADSLIITRMQLHHAIQLPASAAQANLEHKEDLSHLSFEWLDAHHGLFIQPTQMTDQPLRIGINLAELSLVVLNGESAKSFELNGRTQEEAADWLKGELEANGANNPFVLENHVPPEFPAHPIADGAAYVASDQENRHLLIDHYAKTRKLLAKIQEERAEASPIRTWPEHFDMATLLSFDSGEKTIGIGFSPGDPGYPEPYWYVTPWPYPDLQIETPELPAGGHWHREGWFGAVLTDSKRSGDIPSAVDAFFQAGLKTGLKIHGI